MYRMIRTGMLWLAPIFLVLHNGHAFSKEKQHSDTPPINESISHSKSVSQQANLAKDSQSESLYTLGLKYLDGHGVKKNTAKAYRLFKQAANRGYPRAEYQLGILYRDGNGVARDKKEALKWFRLAAAWGDTDAQRALSKLVEELSKNNSIDHHSKFTNRQNSEGQHQSKKLYLVGKNSDKENKRVFRLLQKSANADNKESQYQLGLMYKNGIGTSKDPGKAKKWFGKAASNGSLNARVALSEMLRQDTARQGQKIDTFDTNSRFNFSSGSSHLIAAKKGDINAQYKLGVMYIEGDVLEKNSSEAARWLRSAAKRNHLGAQLKLGELLYRGVDLDRNFVESAMWYRKAAEQGHPSAQYLLGNMYRKGVGLNKSKTKAQQWYRKAAEQGHTKAKDKLAIAD